ncbi:hypothetical protein A2U01_0033039, partial [Trifolium medium]|nr:hypothetical protein [Trifolium medium]
LKTVLSLVNYGRRYYQCPVIAHSKATAYGCSYFNLAGRTFGNNRLSFATNDEEDNNKVMLDLQAELTMRNLKNGILEASLKE